MSSQALVIDPPPLGTVPPPVNPVTGSIHYNFHKEASNGWNTLGIDAADLAGKNKTEIIMYLITHTSWEVTGNDVAKSRINVRELSSAE